MTDRLGASDGADRVALRARRAGAAALLRAVPRRAAGDRQVVRLQAGMPEQDGSVFARVRQLMRHPDFSLTQPEPRAQPDRDVLPRQPRRVPPRRCGGLRVLGRPRARARRHQPAARVAPGTRARPLERARRALSQRGARGAGARRRQARPVERRARDRRARAAGARPDARAPPSRRQPRGTMHGQEERLLRAIGRRHRRHQRLGLRRDRDRAPAQGPHRQGLRRPQRHHRRADRRPDRHRQGIGHARSPRCAARRRAPSARAASSSSRWRRTGANTSA